MSDGQGLVAWFGPVYAGQVPEATVPGWDRVFFPCTGDGKPPCGAYAESWTDATGQRVPRALQAMKRPGAKELALGAFSAGGQIVKRLLMHPTDRAAVRVAALADALYVTDRDASGRPVPPEGFVLYGREAAVDPSKLLLLTVSSSPNKNYPSGSETLVPLVQAVASGSGQEAVELSPGDPAYAALRAHVPPWVKGYRVGQGAFFFDYGSTVKHGEHATKLASPFWQHLVVPYLAAGAAVPTTQPSTQVPPQDATTSAVGHFVAVSAGAYIAFCIAQWALRRR